MLYYAILVYYYTARWISAAVATPLSFPSRTPLGSSTLEGPAEVLEWTPMCLNKTLGWDRIPKSLFKYACTDSISVYMDLH